MARTPKISRKTSATPSQTPKPVPATKLTAGKASADSAADFQEVRTLIELMKKNGLAVFKFEQGDFKITLKTPQGVEGGTLAHGAGAPAAPAASASSASPDAAKPAVSNHKEITSPMVGTFYASSAPEAEAFVNVGQTVNAESVVCIIEAMKVMNEIKAEVSGTIVEIVAENGKPVQFGEVLFRVS